MNRHMTDNQFCLIGKGWEVREYWKHAARENPRMTMEQFLQRKRKGLIRRIKSNLSPVK
ncbi:hypothetical protein ERICIV_01523 [Paenibacillus larvae subsp. larvae]|uniref:Z-ring formation inhibitor MciZ n=2 Tax=Paenibacillus larvae TaxID=1464 RepID=A0A2L1TYC8_9BACL|nr:hypothetical protein [Paenibacillus larvae]AVF25690.1 hypothetical protein ERICIII_01502 [Paenibacillus larvae subsp. larvae]AVF30467.1 hypothetical protein ERICIV_01523 [Paenibacillus larvae subsp. larvae]MCY7519337.1 hypothetical protein [Paenibacillus larvae]MCY9499556.1 hypothetical protein [Paenibacillus larvae]MCY9508890.1 hypothetical protein [Paenibacillus larvae]